MANIEKVSVALTSEQVAAMKAAVDSGEYATASEIVREALREWQASRRMKEEEIRLLRRLIDDGRDSGTAGQIDFNALRREAKARLALARNRTANAG
ncbi:MAG: ribbon-helix-helix domain-containing protein [Hyphomicrobiales bacterium]